MFLLNQDSDAGYCCGSEKENQDIAIHGGTNDKEVENIEKYRLWKDEVAGSWLWG